jgi:hypothetical protein
VVWRRVGFRLLGSVPVAAVGRLSGSGVCGYSPDAGEGFDERGCPGVAAGQAQPELSGVGEDAVEGVFAVVAFDGEHVAQSFFE